MSNPFELINTYFDKIFIITLTRATERHEKITHQLKGLNFEFLFGVDGKDLIEEQLISEGAYSKQLAKKHHLWNQPMIMGQIACSWSHKKIYELQCRESYQKVLILEDDVVLNSSGIKLFSNMINELPPSWELLYMDYHKRTDDNLLSRYRKTVFMIQHLTGRTNWTPAMIRNLYARPYSEHLKKAGYHEYTSAYAITLSAAQKLLRLQTPISFIADNLLGYAISNNQIEAYLSLPKLFEQESQQQGGNNYSYVTDTYDNGL
jgi:glycosyl transferase family 25